MLIQFTTENFNSIKDRVSLSMTATRFKEHPDNIQSVENHGLNLLKSACIYGPNASGKTNLVRAILFFSRFIVSSAKTQVGDGIGGLSAFKLNTETENKPSFFEMDFVIGGVLYRYGFEADVYKVHREWLYAVINKKEVNFFKREGGGIETTRHFPEGKGVKDKTRENALFLSVVAQFNGEISAGIVKWFRGLSVLSEGIPEKRSIERVLREDLKHELLMFLRAADLGIEDMVVTEKTLAPDDLPAKMPDTIKKMILSLPANSRVVEKSAMHKKFGPGDSFVALEALPFAAESKGTMKIFNLFGYLYDALLNGTPVVVDELEGSLHPLLVEWLIGLFNSAENKLGSQLIFTTHDVNVLDRRHFRRDQVWFTEKDAYGASRLFSLSEYGSRIRNDASFAKDYMFGKYGAIPVLKRFRPPLADTERA